MPRPKHGTLRESPLQRVDALSSSVAFPLAVAVSTLVVVSTAQRLTIAPVMLAALLLPTSGVVLMHTARGRLERLVHRQRWTSTGALGVVAYVLLVVPLAVSIEQVWPAPDGDERLDADVIDDDPVLDLDSPGTLSTTGTTGSMGPESGDESSTTSRTTRSGTSSGGDPITHGEEEPLGMDLGALSVAVAGPDNPEAFLEDPPVDKSRTRPRSPEYPLLAARSPAGVLEVPGIVASRPLGGVPRPPDPWVCPDGMKLISGGILNTGHRSGKLQVVQSFCMDITEVTIAKYEECMINGLCTKADRGIYCNRGTRRDDHPMNCVDWNQAVAYCEWRGGKLPTEEEWQWAAQGRDAERSYPWGEQEPTCGRVVMDDSANVAYGGFWRSHWGCDEGSTWPVGSKSSGDSRDGLKDMAGNVWEWTQTGNELLRIVRGGSWTSGEPDIFRVSFRYSSRPSTRNDNIGFRCARDPARSRQSSG